MVLLKTRGVWSSSALNKHHALVRSGHFFPKLFRCLFWVFDPASYSIHKCYATMTPINIKVMFCATDHSFFHYVYTKHSTTESPSRRKMLTHHWQRILYGTSLVQYHNSFHMVPQTKTFQMKISAVLQDLTYQSPTTGNTGEQNLFYLSFHESVFESKSPPDLYIRKLENLNQNYASLETKWIQIFKLCKAKLQCVFSGTRASATISEFHIQMFDLTSSFPDMILENNMFTWWNVQKNKPAAPKVKKNKAICAFIALGRAICTQGNVDGWLKSSPVYIYNLPRVYMPIGWHEGPWRTYPKMHQGEAEETSWGPL